MFKKAATAVIILGVIALAGLEIPAWAQHGGTPSVLSIRERAALVHKITAKRLETLLPRMMRETGIDMWIISCNEDNLDPIFETMVPYENWNPITQILVLFDQGPAKGVERLNVSRTDTQDLFKKVWDAAAWDAKKGESQWEALGRIVRERDPKRIGLNEGEVQWAAGALTSVLKKKLVEAVGPKYAARFQSAEPLATLWAETLLEEEVELMERAAALSRSIIADMFSPQVVTVGQTTSDDLRWYYWQRVADLGLKVSFSPFVSIRGRAPKDVEKWGKDDKVIRPGDLLHCDVGLKYMRWTSDHQERPTSCVPAKRTRRKRSRSSWPKPTASRTSTAGNSGPGSPGTSSSATCSRRPASWASPAHGSIPTRSAISSTSPGRSSACPGSRSTTSAAATSSSSP
jgi:hypothetical protein